MGLTSEQDNDLVRLIERIRFLGLGLLVFILHPKIALGQKKVINLWVREGTPNIDLAVLVALQLEKNWEAKIRLVQAATDGSGKQKSNKYLIKLKKMTRIPDDAEISILIGGFEEAITNAPTADINIFGMPEELDMARKRYIAEK